MILFFWDGVFDQKDLIFENLVGSSLLGFDHRKDTMESSLIHHIIIVLLLLWFISLLNRSHAFFYFLALIYLYLVLVFSFLLSCFVLLTTFSGNGKDCCFACFFGFLQVHERYVMRLKRKLQFEERKQANQRRVLLKCLCLYSFF